MNWLNPIALWGLTALVIPILIHLWSKNKTKEIAFGSIRFLRESSTLQSKKIQLSEIPLLLVRLIILVLVVMLMARWVNYQEVEKQKALLLGEDVKVPEAYANDEITVFRASAFGENSNHWYLLEELAVEHPEIDSLIYINDFRDTDFVGAIPKLNFQSELISANQKQNSQGKRNLDTLLIHFAELSETVQGKFVKVLKANQLYTNGKVNFKEAKRSEAQLIFTLSPQKLETNQIVVSDSISSNYQIQKKYQSSLLYLNESWLNNPLNEDMFLLIVSEYIAQVVEPNYQYSSFDMLYTKKSEGVEEVKEAKTFDEELLWLIVLLILLERYFSFRKKHV
ncbi:BatA domain-containing protein [Marivirga salinae]|uniref:BatA domain-containing protein n=1 Tax=Marivirga salinarum TaxID=3059078 RepID=A0AA51N9C2_9BACT|nr:BatA domain-containing protein [Marivirga sp. BDSF4-3]WMN10978.1 BatA domain-containing protein [Marivirga sp. BDSF4-3]